MENCAVEEYIEKRSRFIGSVCPVSTKEEALEFIETIKSKNRDARHNVFAFLLSDGFKQCSDDGEPSGTAGVPILDILEKQGVTNCVVVVTRYFGGILLGTGGLVRAYSAAASLSLKSAGIIKMIQLRKCRLVCNYNIYSRVPSVLSRFCGKIIESDFGENVTLTISLPDENCTGFSEIIKDISCGEFEPEYLELFFEKEKGGHL